MNFAIGDKVKVLASKDEVNYYHSLKEGVVTTIALIHDGEEFPYELEGYSESVREDEIEHTEEELTQND